MQVPNRMIYTLELVVQRASVWRFDDPVHLVTCSYELGGIGISSVKEITDNELARQADTVQANPSTAQSKVVLTVRDVNNQEVTSVPVGSYIQLVALMNPVGTELSFRMWSCRAFSNESGIFAEHHIMYEGCGDDQVISRNRGFRTSKMTDDHGNTTRMARSVFFLAFQMGNHNPNLRFECYYIIKDDTSTDGPSCKRSPVALSRRGKRSSIKSSVASWSVAGGLDLPHSQTEEIKITPARFPVYKTNVITDTLRGAKSDAVRPTNNLRYPNLLANDHGDVTPTDALTQDSLLRQPLVLGLLITCFLLVTALVAGLTVLLIHYRPWTDTVQ